MPASPPPLPQWPPGTVAILGTAGAAPHAIPVSTAVRAGDARVLFALARRRESLARLREDPHVTLTLLCEGDVAVTALGRARVLQEPMEVSDRVAAVEIAVTDLEDHNQPSFAIIAGVRWEWTDPQSRDADEDIRRALNELAGVQT